MGFAVYDKNEEIKERIIGAWYEFSMVSWTYDESKKTDAGGYKIN